MDTTTGLQTGLEECSYTGQFDCTKLDACKSTIVSPNTISYHDDWEEICNPTQNAARKKAALDSGEAPYGWSDQQNSEWEADNRGPHWTQTHEKELEAKAAINPAIFEYTKTVMENGEAKAAWMCFTR